MFVPCRKEGSAMMSTTVSAARVTRGFPANVDPWSPGAMASATACFTSTAPMGSPPGQQHSSSFPLPAIAQAMQLTLSSDTAPGKDKLSKKPHK